MQKDNIYVTKPDLPPLEELYPFLQDIWDSKQLTNCGLFHKKLEKVLCQYLNVEFISLVSSGTTALLAALNTIEDKRGDIITTPFSFVATSHAIKLLGFKPKFVDIEYETLNISPSLIEESIDDTTKGIVPVHCFGNSCKTKEINQISEKHKLPLIYDAAQAFGSKIRFQNIFLQGDLSIISFHATKVFTTLEGGAIISKTKAQKEKIDKFINFGFVNETTIDSIGINGKLNEISSLVGLKQLKYIKENIEKRKKIYNKYFQAFKEVKGIQLIRRLKNNISNNSYFPILINKDFPINRDKLYDYLKEKKIITRKYFYPLISNLTMYKDSKSASPENLPIANLVSEQILCLPIYASLKDEEQEYVINSFRQIYTN
tara:strand:+ start:98 stop:1219 length:1122 start_codon:yes stop_codon:yes gene_type:complete